MFFKFTMWNHSPMGQRSLEDVIGIIGKQLEALGHQCIWIPGDAQFIGANDGVNVVVEGFTPLHTSDLARAHAAGARFLCLATEEPTDKGFNQGTQKEMVARQEWFIPAAKYFDGIIHLVQGERVNKWYNQFAPSAAAELGYARSLIRSIHHSEPKFEVGFFGSLSKRRLQILKRLAKRINKPNAIRVEATFAEQDVRDKLMQEAKVIVQIRKFDTMTLFSNSRAVTTICNGRPLVCESGHEASDEWRGIVPFAKTEEEFYNLVFMALATWRGLHAGQLDKFKTIMTPERCIGRALDEIGILHPRKVAA